MGEWNTPSAFGQIPIAPTGEMPTHPVELGKTHTMPSKDIEDAHYHLNDIIHNLLNVDKLDGQALKDHIDDLYAIENLIYRNFK